MSTHTGLVHVYTGEGKGKTTAAVGLATRALGFGLKVVYASFHKRPELYGYHEIRMLERMQARILVFAPGHPHLDKSLDTELIAREVEEGLGSLRALLQQDPPDLLVMDEILISVRDGFLDAQSLYDFVRSKPATTELVLTGRGATPEIIEMADYVSEVGKIKHPYDKGISSRGGIEF